MWAGLCSPSACDFAHLACDVHIIFWACLPLSLFHPWYLCVMWVYLGVIIWMCFGDINFEVDFKVVPIKMCNLYLWGDFILLFLHFSVINCYRNGGNSKAKEFWAENSSNTFGESNRTRSPLCWKSWTSLISSVTLQREERYIIFYSYLCQMWH